MVRFTPEVSVSAAERALAAELARVRGDLDRAHRALVDRDDRIRTLERRLWMYGASVRADREVRPAVHRGKQS